MEVSNALYPLKYLLLFIVLVLVQVLICNNILLFGVAVPFIFIYFIIALPLDTNLNLLIIISFLLGFFVDIFSDTLGLNCLACLLLSVLKKPFFYAYMPKEDKFKTAVPCIAVMGWINYLKYILTLSALFCIIIFGIEFLSLVAIPRLLLMIGSSTLITMVLLLATDAIVNKASE